MNLHAIYVGMALHAKDAPTVTARQPRKSPLAYTVLRFCEEAGISRSAAYTEIAKGTLPAKKIGRRTIILRDDAVRFLIGLPAARGGQ